VREDVLNLERRIARIEAEELLEEGELDKALKRIGDAMDAPTPELYAVRGEILLAQSEALEGEARDELVVKAVADLERGLTEPTALLKAGKLLWEDEALIFEGDRVARARSALKRAEDILETSAAGMEKDSEARERYLGLLEEVNVKLKEMRDLAARYLHGARAEYERDKLESALSLADRAVELLGDHVPAYQLQGRILRDLAAQGGDDADACAREARDAFANALRMDNLLVTQRLSLMDDMVRLQLDVLKDRRSALDWLDRYRRAAESADEELRDLYLPKVEELERAANG
jgi:hypothetical protein